MSRKEQKQLQRAAVVLFNSIPETATVVHPKAVALPQDFDTRTVADQYKKSTPAARYLVARGQLFFLPPLKMAA